ncbi:protein BIG GRAIN 1-like [Dendrobium catenatum]|uniref:Protein BIG GRAIN 1-like B n=1 Tax=Dendrobium catenatum TaxID=906689 RepID=A0A2I0VL22_9ASPA|nr:protein BIG GRAIN 1-like [Dendrobium catenatum]PKU64107.1 hypothetical protein MA16_Dca008013 [Dendrobium catenatum]
MERWRDGASKSPQCRYRDHPSFSSTLLDAIYRSIDDEHRADGDSFSSRKKQSDARRWIPPVTLPEIARSGREHWSRRSSCSAGKPPVTRSSTENWNPATSSSSDGSSYGGFSSSETESVSTRLRSIRSSPPRSSSFPARSGGNRPATRQPQPSLPTIAGAEEKRAKKERQGSIRSRLLRELRKGRAPASPGARLANFLNSLFAAKSKVSRNAVAGVEESVCSSASSYSRSCLSKTTSSRGQPASVKRTVRFCPISVIVDEDCRPCGHKCVYAGDRPPTSVPVRSVAEMLRSSELEEEEEDDEEEDGESDSSSDLFELENLAIIGRFRDELPVYETTRLGSYSGISHRLVL